MKRYLAVALIALLIVVFPARGVSGAQLVALDFEGFVVISNSVDEVVQNTDGLWEHVASIVVSLPTERYLAGVTVDWDVSYVDLDDSYTGSGTAELRVEIGSTTATTSKTDSASGGGVSALETFSFTGLYGDSFTVDIYVRTSGSIEPQDVLQVTVNNVYIYTLDENYGVKSKLTEYTLIPPGVDDTSRGFLVDKTEILLGQTYTLNEGAVSFWLKWDGTKNIMLSDNIGIDSNGHLYIKNDAGTKYALEVDLTPFIGTYVPVYISWGQGQGYIMVNSTKVLVNWDGDFIISKVGDLSTSSATIIDEFKLYDTYIPPEAFEKGSDTAYVAVAFPGGDTTQLTIKSMDGSSFDKLTFSLFATDWTPVGSTTWGFGQNPTLNASSDEGAFLVIESTSASTTVFVRPGVSEMNVSFPGTSAEYIQATIEPVQYPSQEQRVWQWLVVKDSQNSIVYMSKWNFTATDVVLKSGGTYLIEVATPNLSEVQTVYIGLASPVIKINLPRLEELTLFENLTTYYRVDGNSLQVYFYDPEGKTESINLVLYDVFDNVLLNTTYANTSLLNFRSDFLPYKFVLTFEREGHTVPWGGIIGHVEEGVDEPFPFPKELVSLVLIMMMLFSFSALDAHWAPVMTLTFSSALAVAGVVTMPVQVASFLSVGGFLGFMGGARLNFASIKQLASQVLVVIILLQVAGGIAEVIAEEMGLGGIGMNVDALSSTTKEQLVTWANYTPQYTELGAPLSTDTKNFASYVSDVFNGAKYIMMSLGAPEPIATSFQTFLWLLEAVLLIYLLFGREV